MSKTETKSRIGEALSPAQEASRAIIDFVSNFRDFQATIEKNFNKQKSD